jgi:hypothetical protein
MVQWNVLSDSPYYLVMQRLQSDVFGQCTKALSEFKTLGQLQDHTCYRSIEDDGRPKPSSKAPRSQSEALSK